MSMRNYGVNDYGLVLNTNHLRVLAANICDDYSADEWNAKKYEYIEYVCERLCMESISEFDGDAIPVLDNGEDDWRNSEPYGGDTIYYIPLCRTPTLFEAAYKDIEEVVEEIKNKRVSKCLPKDFDYRNNIRHIIGVYFA